MKRQRKGTSKKGRQPKRSRRAKTGEQRIKELTASECEYRGWGWIHVEARDGGGFSKDFGGFADFIGMDETNGCHIAIQSTSKSNHSTRVRKLTGQIDGEKVCKVISRLDNELSWLRSGGRIVVWSWAYSQQAYGMAVRETEIWPADIEKTIAERFSAHVAQFGRAVDLREGTENGR